MSDIEKLDIVSKNIESFGFKRDQTWNLLYNYAKDVRYYGYELPITTVNYKEWIKLEYKEIFNQKKTNDIDDDKKFSYPQFQRLLKEGDFERLHSYLIQRGSIPPEIDAENDIAPLVDIYLRKGNMSNVRKLLRLL